MRRLAWMLMLNVLLSATTAAAAPLLFEENRGQMTRG